jgi:hypothetical protein
MSETRILIKLFSMYFQRNWEFGSAWLKLQNFGHKMPDIGEGGVSNM